MLPPVFSLTSPVSLSPSAWIRLLPADAVQLSAINALTVSRGEDLGLAFCLALLIPTAVMLGRAIRQSLQRHRRMPPPWTRRR